MTFEQVVEIDKPALHQLESGAVLRYEPADHAVYILPYPATPRSWREASLYLLTVPSDGWNHYLGCGCAYCAAAGAADGGASS
jgi:hypothetical protein